VDGQHGHGGWRMATDLGSWMVDGEWWTAFHILRPGEFFAGTYRSTNHHFEAYASNN